MRIALEAKRREAGSAAAPEHIIALRSTVRCNVLDVIPACLTGGRGQDRVSDTTDPERGGME